MYLIDQVLKCLFIKIDEVDIKVFIYGVKQIQDVVELNLCSVQPTTMKSFLLMM